MPSVAFRFSCSTHRWFPSAPPHSHWPGLRDWKSACIEASDQADLFLCESYVFDKEVAPHNSYRNIMQNRARLTCKRILLTHMSEDVLARADEVELPTAEDGLQLIL